MTTAVSSSTTNSTTTGQTSAQQQLAGNFDTFLKLLTTQLQNQDPMSPMDSNQFTQQLVEYSQVEQQIDTNTNLTTLINQGSSTTGSYAVSYLGKAVTVANGNAPLSNGQAVWAYNLGATASNTTLTVTDANGNAVYSGAGDTASGAHTFTWDGKDSNGNKLADGTYKLTVGATASDGSSITTSVTSTGEVSAIDMTGSTPQLMIGQMAISLSDIAGVQTL